MKGRKREKEGRKARKKASKKAREEKGRKGRRKRRREGRREMDREGERSTGHGPRPSKVSLEVKTAGNSHCGKILPALC